ncbi:MAG: dTDP-4-dehydrorhamnose reductase [bacterium]
MRIIITGANGMLGSDLCEILRARKKFEVFPFYGDVGAIHESPKTSDAMPAGRQERRVIDITDRSMIEAGITEIKPDIIIHTAAYTDVDGCETNREMAYQVNALGAQNVALAAKKSGAFLIYISTDYVFDGGKKGPYLENDAPNPMSIYGKSKLDGEKFIQNILSDWAIIRISWLFGLNGKNFVKSIIKQIHDSRFTIHDSRILKVVDDQIGSPTYTGDLSKGISFFLENGCKTGIYHLTNQGFCSWFEFAKKIVELTGNAGKIMVEPVNSSQFVRPAKRPRNSVLENYVWKSKGYPLLRNWEEALEEYLVESSVIPAKAGIQ